VPKVTCIVFGEAHTAYTRT